jgi:hypothetical protein
MKQKSRDPRTLSTVFRESFASCLIILHVSQSDGNFCNSNLSCGHISWWFAFFNFSRWCFEMIERSENFASVEITVGCSLCREFTVVKMRIPLKISRREFSSSKYFFINFGHYGYLFNILASAGEVRADGSTNETPQRQHNIIPIHHTLLPRSR